MFEPNPGDPNEAWYINSDGLEDWFEHYIDDTDWWNKVEDGHDLGHMQPWTDNRLPVGDGGGCNVRHGHPGAPATAR